MSCTLYLVSAEHDGLAYWKVGVTDKADPLKRDPKRYREVFRAVSLPDKESAEYVEWHIAKAFCRIDCPVGKEALNGRASLESVCALFDQFVEWHQDGLIAVTEPESSAEEAERYHREVVFEDDPAVEDVLRTHLPVWRRYDELVAEIKQSLAFVPSTPVQALEPMWA